MNTGLAWHVHHDKLVEWCTDYDGRVQYIHDAKPISEQKTRLELFKFVNTPPADVVAAWGELYKAWESRFVNPTAHSEAWGNYLNTFTSAMPALIELHEVECQNCPWDGNTIFPKEPR